MVSCPHCRQPAAPSGRICLHCGLELPGRTRLGMSFPESDLLRTTLLGPPTDDASPSDPDVTAPGEPASSGPPRARRFEVTGQATLFGHTRKDDAEPAPPAPAQPRTLGSAAESLPQPDEVEPQFRVRGRKRTQSRPVRAQRPVPMSRRLALWGSSLPTWVVLAAVGLAGLGGAAAALVVPRAPGIKVIGFEVTPAGQDLLTLSCSACPDGSVLRLGSAEATLARGIARLPSSGLAVGDNLLRVELDPPHDEPSSLELSVALAFRVSTDLRGMMEVPPYALVIVAAPRGTSVSIAGTPVASDPGVVRAQVDLGSSATGPEPRPVELQRTVGVRVVGPDIDRSTHATIAGTVVPLVLDGAPTLEQGQLRIRGRTAAGARMRLSRAGAVLTEAQADAEGHFLLRAGALPAGPCTVAASAPGRISRQVACSIPSSAGGSFRGHSSLSVDQGVAPAAGEP